MVGWGVGPTPPQSSPRRPRLELCEPLSQWGSPWWLHPPLHQPRHRPRTEGEWSSSWKILGLLKTSKSQPNIIEVWTCPNCMACHVPTQVAWTLVQWNPKWRSTSPDFKDSEVQKEKKHMTLDCSYGVLSKSASIFFSKTLISEGVLPQPPLNSRKTSLGQIHPLSPRNLDLAGWSTSCNDCA